MLNKIKLTNFRKHKDTSIAFSEGLNVIQCRNEAGKSTLVEGIGYALYGAKALGNSDFTTWGESEGSTKVELSLTVNDKQIEFKRSKKGATCDGDGVAVSSMSGVTNYAAELLGADYNKASNLMLAPQFKVVGALDEGSKGLAEQIENLAGLDFFDTLLTQAQSYLICGNEAIFVAAHAAAEKQLSEAKFEPEDTGKKEAEVLQNKAKQGVLELEAIKAKACVETSFTEVKEKEKALTKCESANVLANKIVRELEQLTSRKTDLASVVVSGEGICDSIAAAEKELSDAKSYESLLSAKDSIDKLNAETLAAENWLKKLPKNTFDVESAQSLLEKLGKEELTLASEKISLQSSIVKGNICPTCKTVLIDVTAHEEHNNKSLERIKLLNSELLSVQKRIKDIEGDLTSAEKQAKEANAAATDLANCKAKAASVCEALGSLARIKEDGTIVFSFEAKKEIRSSWDISKLLDELKAKKTQTDRATVVIKELADQKAVKDGELMEAQADSAGLEIAKSGLSVAKELLRVASISYDRLVLDIAEVKATLAKIEQDIAMVKQANKYKEAALRSAQKALELAESNLRDVKDNNSFIKKIRSLRPQVADKLWGQILPAVSDVFSRMRGEVSVLAKGVAGFTVNGKPTSTPSLSGSARELLGLALRVVLTKIFLPNIDFIILDEPFASFDEERTKSALGCLPSLGFRQTLLITHETVSRDVADCLITW